MRYPAQGCLDVVLQCSREGFEAQNCLPHATSVTAASACQLRPIGREAHARHTDEDSTLDGRFSHERCLRCSVLRWEQACMSRRPYLAARDVSVQVSHRRWYIGSQEHGCLPKIIRDTSGNVIAGFQAYNKDKPTILSFVLSSFFQRRGKYIMQSFKRGREVRLRLPESQEMFDGQRQLHVYDGRRQVACNIYGRFTKPASE